MTRLQCTKCQSESLTLHESAFGIGFADITLVCDDCTSKTHVIIRNEETGVGLTLAQEYRR